MIVHTDPPPCVLVPSLPEGTEGHYAVQRDAGDWLISIEGTTYASLAPHRAALFALAENAVDFAQRCDELVSVYLGGKPVTYSVVQVRSRARPAEDLTPEGIQLVIPGAERQQPSKSTQLNLF